MRSFAVIGPILLFVGGCNAAFSMDSEQKSLALDLLSKSLQCPVKVKKYNLDGYIPTVDATVWKGAKINDRILELRKVYKQTQSGQDFLPNGFEEHYNIVISLDDFGEI